LFNDEPDAAEEDISILQCRAAGGSPESRHAPNDFRRYADAVGNLANEELHIGSEVAVWTVKRVCGNFLSRLCLDRADSLPDFIELGCGPVAVVHSADVSAKADVSGLGSLDYKADLRVQLCAGQLVVDSFADVLQPGYGGRQP